MLFDQKRVETLGDFRPHLTAAQMTANGKIVLVPEPSLHLVERAALGREVERPLNDVGAIHNGSLVGRPERTITQVSRRQAAHRPKRKEECEANLALLSGRYCEGLQ